MIDPGTDETSLKTILCCTKEIRGHDNFLSLFLSVKQLTKRVSSEKEEKSLSGVKPVQRRHNNGLVYVCVTRRKCRGFKITEDTKYTLPSTKREEVREDSFTRHAQHDLLIAIFV